MQLCGNANHRAEAYSRRIACAVTFARAGFTRLPTRGLPWRRWKVGSGGMRRNKRAKPVRQLDYEDSQEFCMTLKYRCAGGRSPIASFTGNSSTPTVLLPRGGQLVVRRMRRGASLMVQRREQPRQQRYLDMIAQPPSDTGRRRRQLVWKQGNLTHAAWEL